MAVPARTRSGDVELGVQSLTLEGAIDHLVEAAQGLVSNELDLAKLEVRLTATRILQSAAMVLVGAILLGGASVALAMAGYQMFPPEVTPAARLAIIAGACAVLGLALTLVGTAHMRTDERH